MAKTIDIAGPHDCWDAATRIEMTLVCSASGITVDIGLFPYDGLQGETHWTQTHPPGTAPGDVIIDGSAFYSQGDNLSCDYQNAVVTATPILSSSNECCDDLAEGPPP